jgi:DNA-damage-inducible protein J
MQIKMFERNFTHLPYSLLLRKKALELFLIKCILIVMTLSVQNHSARRVKMAKTAVIQTRIDPAIKQQAQTILKKLNISMSEAISMYLSQITLHNGIPFELKIPNTTTAKTLMDTDNGNELHTVGSVDDLFEELDN